MSDPSDRNLQAALECASRGWAVFPCHPQNKQPLIKGDIDPASGEVIRGTGGLKKATSDPLVIRAWWSRWPKALIGVPTGHSIGAFVVDIDAGVDEATGEEFTVEALLAALELAIGVSLPETVTCRTPRGGLHLYFSVTTEADMPGNRTGMLPRIDVRGDGGYVIVPPSARPDGKNYSWSVAPRQMRPAVAPRELLNLISQHGSNATRSAKEGSKQSNVQLQSPADNAQRRYALTALDAELRELRAAIPGTRNDCLFHASIRLGQLVTAGALDIAIVRAGLENVARDWPNLGKSRGTIESGLSKGLKEPRDLSEVGSRRAKRRIPHLDGSADDIDDVDRRLAFLDMTDLGNAERFRERNRDRFLHCGTSGWFWWDGRRWSQNGAEGALLRAVHDVVRAIKLEADAIEDAVET